ncbi:MAG TPA: carbohydrate-binding family 9-like protein, partial [bacterium]
NIPEGEKFAHIDGFFPKDLTKREVDPSGWIFCHAGKTFIAYFPLKPYQWIDEADCFRLRSFELKNGCVVEVTQEEDYPSFEAFKEQIQKNTLVHDTFDKTLMVSYTTSAGDVMTFKYDGARRLNGKLINFADYKLFRGPFLNAEVGSRSLEIKYKNKGMILDMKTQKQGQILPLYTCKKIADDFPLTGKLDHPNWANAHAAQLVDAITGKPGRFKTEVRVLYSDKYLYVGFLCQDDYIWGTITERDGPIYDEECIEVFLNPADTKHQYYEINLSPKNVVYDANVLNSRTPENAYGKFLAQPQWNLENLQTAVYVDGKIDEQGKSKSWTAEYAIPFDEIFGALHTPPQPGDTWRVNFYRIDSSQKDQREHYAWSPTERAAFHLPWKFGYLRFGK